MKIKYFLTISGTLTLIFFGLYCSELSQKRKFQNEFDLLVLSFDTLKKEKSELKDRLDSMNGKLKLVERKNYDSIREKTSLEQEVESAQGQLENSKRQIEDLRFQIAKNERMMLSMKKQLFTTSTASIEQRSVLEGQSSATQNELKALVYYNVGVMLGGSSMYEKAIEAFKKAIEFDDSNFDAHYNLAMLYMDYEKSPKKALVHFSKYLSMNTDAEDSEEILYTIGKLEAKLWITDKISESKSNL